MGRCPRGGFSTLKRQADFDQVFAQKTRFFRSGVGFYVRRHPGEGFRFGFMVSKRFGNAVERNTFRRRMRELIRLATSLPPGTDLIITTGKPCREYSYARLKDILAWALARVTRTTPAWGNRSTTKEPSA